MLNSKQIDLAEKILVNAANVILAGIVVTNFVGPNKFHLPSFLIGCSLFTGFAGIAFWLRRKD